MAPANDPSFLTTADGTRLAVYRAGNPAGPALVLANGLGGNIRAWRHLIDHFSDRCRFVSWDYRGLYRSGPPSTPDRVTMDDHAADLEALLAHEGITRAVFVGWSMGVQLVLEYYRRHPEAFASMVLINGTYGRPLDTAFRSVHLKRAFPYLVDLMRGHAHRLMPIVPPLVKTGAVTRLLKAAGLVAPTLDESVFTDLAAEFVNLDFVTYGNILETLAAHNARDVLPLVRVPTLIVTGECDLFTPKEVSEEMRDTIPGAELFLVPTGTHYTPVEYPELVNLRIESFLRATRAIA